MRRSPPSPIGTPLTSGHLRDAAVNLACTAASRAAEDAPTAQAPAIRHLVVVAHRHARFLALPFKGNSPIGVLATHLAYAIDTEGPAADPSRPPAPFVLTGRKDTPAGDRATELWWQAADPLAIGHDLLTSQLGPDRTPSGPDAEALLLTEPVNGATARLVDITRTVAAGALAGVADIVQNATVYGGTAERRTPSSERSAQSHGRTSAH